MSYSVHFKACAKGYIVFIITISLPKEHAPSFIVTCSKLPKQVRL